MRKSTTLFSALSLSMLALLGACSDSDSPSMNGAGKIKASFSADYNVAESRQITRAGLNEEAMKPEIGTFAVHLTKDDGSLDRNYASVAEFPTDENFPVGSYTIEASYGSLSEEGFEKPYYLGSAQFRVLDEQVASPSVTCTLANTMVSVDYTEAFKKYFTDYKTTIHSDGGEYIDFVAGETRAAYVRPGNISIAMDLTKTDGTNVKVQPASISNAQARTIYKITFDVNGGQVSDAVISITFDSSTESEPVTLDLSNDLLNAPAPTATTKGFTSGTAVSVLEGDTPSSALQMALTAMSGFQEVKLTTASDYLINAGWPAECDLANLSESQKALLTSKGLQMRGFDGKSLMALLDFSKVVAGLNANGSVAESTFTVVVKDKYTKVSDPVSLVVSTEPIVLNISNPSAFVVGSTSFAFDFEYNGSDLEKNVTFKAYNAYGSLVDCKIVSATAISRAASKYRVTLEVPALSSTLKVFAVYKNNMAQSETIAVNCTEPAITATVGEAGAWATSATINVACEEVSFGALASLLKVYVSTDGGSNYTETKNVTADTGNSTLTITGLTAATAYKVRVSATSLDKACAPASFTTEAKTQVPNGDFETLTQTINVSGMNQGGKWSPTIANPTYQSTCSFTISEPTGWASINKKTCNTSASNQMSWFVCPSTYNTTLTWTGTVPRLPIIGGGGTETPTVYQDLKAQNGKNAMVVRNVTWDDNGTSPANHYKTRTAPYYYSENVPELNHRSAGRLFLGSYSYASGSETFNEGVSFTTRPSKLEGYYMYANDSQDTDERGVVTVTLLNGSTVIGKGEATLGAAGSYTKFSVPITYTNRNLKATQLRVMITSSNHTSESSIKTTNYISRYEATSRGAMLTVDNLTFAY